MTNKRKSIKQLFLSESEVSEGTNVKDVHDRFVKKQMNMVKTTVPTDVSIDDLKKRDEARKKAQEAGTDLEEGNDPEGLEEETLDAFELENKTMEEEVEELEECGQDMENLEESLDVARWQKLAGLSKLRD